MRTPSGIYVEINIQDNLDHVWLLTQGHAAAKVRIAHR